MAMLKPWYQVVTPREDLRDDKPHDASEFAVHLDQVRDHRAPAVYQKPEQFFNRTFLTKSLTALAVEVLRRLSGINTETSAVFNMRTQFGGGKTHSLLLLYHLASHGEQAKNWQGVQRLLNQANIQSVPIAEVAVFVGTEFDPLTGRGGSDGTPHRKTPWGEIAYQLGGESALQILAEHEKQGIAPGGDVIRQFLPTDKPVLILMDELMNFVSRSRKSGMATQFYTFLHNLSEEARGRNNMVLAVSIPASELEMSVEDFADYERLKKVLDRVGKAVMMSVESETAEIIKRRLFEWDEQHLTPDGRVNLNREALTVCTAFADWVQEHRSQLPDWFPVDSARDAFITAYPFHPSVLSVFERKWRTLPRFQQTRGILRLLALWVAKTYQIEHKNAQRDVLIGLGSAPLDDTLFRSALFEQLGEHGLEGAVTTDICGKKDSHAVRLDSEAIEEIRKTRLHRKVATTIFFESNGGIAKAEATIPEIRLAVSAPDTDIGNIETALEALTDACYYLSVVRNRYHFSVRENLNKRYADRRANIKTDAIEECIRNQIQQFFARQVGIDCIYFPVQSNQIPDRPVLTLIVLSPEQTLEEELNTKALIETMLRESGGSARTFKSALLFAVPQTATQLKEDARRLLAWEDIQEELPDINLDENQRQQLKQNLNRVQRDLKESVWRSYKNILLLGKDNQIKVLDMGLIYSSSAESLIQCILNYLRQSDEIHSVISPNFLIRHWPPAFIEWSTKSVRDAFYASPIFPRLLSADAIKQTIATGVKEGLLAYVGKQDADNYSPFIFKESLEAKNIEISDETFIINQQSALAYLEKQKKPEEPIIPVPPKTDEVETTKPEGVGHPKPEPYEPTPTPSKTEEKIREINWQGEIPAQKWMNFYTRVLSKFAANSQLKLSLKVEIVRDDGIQKNSIEETRAALRELGLDDKLE